MKTFGDNVFPCTLRRGTLNFGVAEIAMALRFPKRVAPDLPKTAIMGWDRDLGLLPYEASEIKR